MHGSFQSQHPELDAVLVLQRAHLHCISFLLTISWSRLSPLQIMAVSCQLGMGSYTDTFVPVLPLWSSFQKTACEAAPQCLQRKCCCYLEGAVQGATPRGSPTTHFAFHLLWIPAGLPGLPSSLCFVQVAEDVNWQAGGDGAQPDPR